MLLSLLGITFSCFLIYHFSKQFEVASLYLGRFMSAGVRGATLNAVSSSLPELFTAMLSLFFFADKEGFAFGVGTAAGSAVFNAAVIPALAIFAFLIRHTRHLKANKKIILRDGIFLLFAELFFLYCILQGTLSIAMMALLVSVYFLYTMTLYFSSKNGKEVEDYEHIDVQQINIWRAILTLNFSDFFMIRNKRITTAVAIKIALGAIAGMGIACHFLVESCYHLADVFAISPYFTAVLFAAAATSVPDTVLSVRDALSGRVEDSLANALGSNIFDICIGLGLPALLFIIFVEPISFSPSLLENLVMLEVFLIGITLAVLLIFTLSKTLSKRHAFVLIGLFGFFVVMLFFQIQDNPITKDVFSSVNHAIQAVL
ncbi:MAG: hypothetical protein JXR30_00590 [Alphaproteobacteria bacterium]|nr:hypothetical protein [Alphaproteobacteria bacterium]